MPPPALPQNVSYGSVPFAAYGAAPAAAPPQQRYAAGGFDVTTLDPEALRAEILGEKKSGAKRKAPKEGQLRVAGGETWIDDKLDIWPENDFRIFVGNLGPEARPPAPRAPPASVPACACFCGANGRAPRGAPRCKRSDRAAAAAQVNEDVLARAFQPFPSYVKCRIIKDYKKCKAKAYGFVSFTNHLEGAKALRAMHGKYIGNRPCQLKKSTHTARNAPADGKKRAAMLANPMERITTKRMR